MARWGGGVRELQGVVDAGSSLGRWGRRALPVPRRDEALPAARHEALALVFSNPQAQGCRLFIFIGVRLTFSLYFFFFQPTNKHFRKEFIFVLIFFLFFFLFLFFPPCLVPPPGRFQRRPGTVGGGVSPGLPGARCGAVPHSAAAPGTRPVPAGSSTPGAVS